MKRVLSLAACLAVLLGGIGLFPDILSAKSNGKKPILKTRRSDHRARGNGNKALLKAQPLFRLAKLAMKKGRYAEAEKHMTKLVHLPFGNDPKSQRLLCASYVGLVDALKAQKKWDKALKTAFDALNKKLCFRKPSRMKAELYNLIAECFEKMNKDEKAGEYSQKALDVYDQLDKVRKP